MKFHIKKGLDIPILGEPQQAITEGPPVKSVALLGRDVHGLRPGMAVTVGDRVRLGQTLFVDKRNPDVRFTAPGAGTVTAINRGARRALQSVVIELNGDEAESFEAFSEDDIASLGRQQVQDVLLRSGLWAALRTRPMSQVPSPDSQPAALFVTAIDSNPLAADPDVVIRESVASFAIGLKLVAKLTDGRVYLCTRPDSGIVCPASDQFVPAEFSGPHPAGLVGTHIHLLEPVGPGKTVWHLGYQDVIAIGKLFTNGRLPVERIVAIGGPQARAPRLVRTRVGASTAELLAGETGPGPLRIVSGSVLSGHRASGPLAWLGRQHTQIAVLAEGGDREFLAWAKPGGNKYSSERAFVGRFFQRKGFAMSTTQNGSPRAMVSIGTFEKIMPLDILPTPLLKALLVEDTDHAKELGCLELDEEDLALCSFACNGKYEYGAFLRASLDLIEANG